MPISYQEHADLSCPSCGADFAADVWLVLDAGEQPAEVAALRADSLNIVACPSCGNSGPAGAPLLYHDGAARKVIFAPAPASEEHEWREQARNLHALLVGSIAEEQRRPYLADVDIVQDLAGIGRLLERMARRRGAKGPGAQEDKGTGGQGDNVQAAPVPPTPNTQHPTPSAQPPPLLVAVEALLAADSAEELQTVLDGNPVLLERATDAALAELAEVAVEQREPEIAESLRQARLLLARAAAGGHAQAIDALDRPAIPVDPDPGPEQMTVLLEPALQALMLASSAAELFAALERFPLLALPEVDSLLSERVEQALDLGDERHAAALEDRREALAQLRFVRAAPPAEAPPAADEPTIDEAIEALLLADGEEAMALVIDAYPVLLDDLAAQALWQFAAEARASGDEDLAIFAIECREMLRRVREGLTE